MGNVDVWNAVSGGYCCAKLSIRYSSYAAAFFPSVGFEGDLPPCFCRATSGVHGERSAIRSSASNFSVTNPLAVVRPFPAARWPDITKGTLVGGATAGRR